MRWTLDLSRECIAFVIRNLRMRLWGPPGSLAPVAGCNYETKNVDQMPPYLTTLNFAKPQWMTKESTRFLKLWCCDLIRLCANERSSFGRPRVSPRTVERALRGRGKGVLDHLLGLRSVRDAKRDEHDRQSGKERREQSHLGATDCKSFVVARKVRTEGSILELCPPRSALALPTAVDLPELRELLRVPGLPARHHAEAFENLVHYIVLQTPFYTPYRVSNALMSIIENVERPYTLLPQHVECRNPN